VAIRGEVPGGRSAGRVLLATLTIVSVTVVVAGMASAAVVRAECFNEQIRREQVNALRLPDCRAYEQVSPTQKNLTDAAGLPEIVQASPFGAGVSFFAVAPFPGTAGSGGQAPTYLGVRAPGGNPGEDDWLTAGLLPAAAPGSADQVVGLTEDLAETILFAEEPPLAPGAELGVRNAYVEDNATGAYQLLAPNIGFGKLSFADATPGGIRILFETKAQLPTTNVAPAPGVTNLYEWNGAKPAGERVSLAGVLPDKEAPKGGSVAGPGGPAVPEYSSSTPGGSTSEFYTQNTISEDGSHVFFSDVETGIVYMREPEAGQTVQVSVGQAYWRAATPSGSFAFYTEGEDLYRYNVEAKQREALSSGAAGVLGTLGVSDEGSYAYFVATGKLASNTNGNEQGAEAGADNLYEWHEDTATHTVATTFIARLLGPNSGEKRDEPDWRDYDRGPTEGGGPSGGEKSSRVTPDGKTLLFSSVSQLTTYDNNGKSEFYLYDAEPPLSSTNPVCVSCNPNGGSAVSGARLTSRDLDLTASPERRDAFLTRNLSSDGSRVFFQTEEALVPGDENNQLDVYEWERAREGTDPDETEATDSCERASGSFSASNGGCLYLISTGQSDSPSYFGDASESGDDVFFFTRQSLVSQDQDLNVDVYDARVEGGIPAQNPPPPAPCTSETSCRTSPDPPPVFDPPTSATITGEANLKPPPAVKPKPKKVVVKCPRGKLRNRRHRCVRAKAKHKGKPKK
jgi:hypothetical protein